MSNFWIERVMPLVPMPIPIRLDAERRAAKEKGSYTSSFSRYAVLRTLEEFEIECWHPFRKYVGHGYICLLCRCGVVKK